MDTVVRDKIGIPLANHRHEKFCHEIIRGTKIPEAFLNAGYKGGGKHQKKYAYDLFHRPDIKARIAALSRAAAEISLLDDAWVISRLKAVADTSIVNFLRFNPDGSLMVDKKGHPRIDFKKCTPEALRSVGALEYDARGRLKFKLRDPIPALELLARNRGLLVDKVETTIDAAHGRVYVVADRPMTPEEWEKQFVRDG